MLQITTVANPGSLGLLNTNSEKEEEAWEGGELFMPSLGTLRELRVKNFLKNVSDRFPTQTYKAKSLPR